MPEKGTPIKFAINTHLEHYLLSAFLDRFARLAYTKRFAHASGDTHMRDRLRAREAGDSETCPL